MNKELQKKIKKYNIPTEIKVRDSIYESGTSTSLVDSIHAFAAKYNIDFDSVRYEVELTSDYSDEYATLFLNGTIQKTEEQLQKEIVKAEELEKKRDEAETDRLRALIKKNPKLKKLILEEAGK